MLSNLRLRLVKQKTSINFMSVHKPALLIAFMMIFASIFMLSTKGLNFGIDFTGGVLMEIKAPESLKIEDIRQSLDGLSAGKPSIQEFGEDEVMIKIPGKEADNNMQKQLYAEVQGLLGEDVEFRRVEYVGPQVGKELIMTGIKAFLFSMIGIMIYIWIRYEWQFGLTGLFSLVHDVCVTLLFFVIVGEEFDLSTVAAVLLVAGYSINDTVVVFDRIREMLRKYRKKPLKEVLNMSVNDTLSRTLMTSTTTFVVVGALALFGGEVIKGFTHAMLVGILTGTFSSIFIAAPLLLYMNVRTLDEKAKDEA